MSDKEPRGYFLSAQDGRELIRIGEAIGLDLAGWLADREQSGFVARRDREDEWHAKACRDHDATYAHLRAVIANCDHSPPVGAIRHQLVALLPETRPPDLDMAQRLRDKGMGNLADLAEERARRAWESYGYPAGDSGDK